MARPSTPTVHVLAAQAARADPRLPHELPEHVKLFGAYMARMAQHAVTPREIVKAYLITLSSIQRQEQRVYANQTVDARERGGPRVTFPSGLARRTGSYEHLRHGETTLRPEDFFSRLLFSEAGQRYLNAAQGGRFDPFAARELASRFKKYGLGARMYEALEQAPRLALQAKQLNSYLRRATPREWLEFVLGNIKGVSYAKAGFIASLLGRGDLPTADAREIDYWLVNKKDFSRKGKVAMNDAQSREFLFKLRDRLRDLRMQLPAELQPFYFHLVHHAIWDAVGDPPTQTTHADIVRAMELAGWGD